MLGVSKCLACVTEQTHDIRVYVCVMGRDLLSGNVKPGRIKKQAVHSDFLGGLVCTGKSRASSAI